VQGRGQVTAVAQPDIYLLKATEKSGFLQPDENNINSRITAFG